MSARRFPFITVVLLTPLAAAAWACGDNPKQPTRTTTVASGATTPAVRPVPESAVTAPVVVTFADADSAYRSGQYQDAVRLFSAYGERHPGNAGAQYMIGLSSWKAGDLKSADAAFDRALALDPKHEKALLNSSRVLIDLGRYDDALDRLNSVLEIDSTSSVARRLQGRVLEHQGDIDGAIDAYQQAVLADEQDAWAMNNLGLILIQQGRAEDALPPLARAVEIRSTSPVFQNNLGIALEQTRHFAEATEAFSAALAADSTYSKASVNLARVRDRVDSTGAGAISLPELAQSFQLEIRMLRDSARVVEPDTTAVNEPQR
jgi:tetratricopeptide (TPR) repeat protein